MQGGISDNSETLLVLVMVGRETVEYFYGNIKAQESAKISPLQKQTSMYSQVMKGTVVLNCVVPHSDKTKETFESNEGVHKQLRIYAVYLRYAIAYQKCMF